jgi:hypothetical protein
MSRFAPALREMARQLDVPASARAGLLLEMASDLDAVFEHHVGAGATEAEAQRRAEAAVLGSEEVVSRLGRLHRSEWRGWPEAIGGRLLRGSDLVLLGLGVVPVLLLSGSAAARALALGADPLVWPLLALGGAIVVLIPMEVGRVLGGGRGGTGALPVLVGLGALAGAIGVAGATSAGWRATRVLAAADPAPGVAQLLLAEAARGGALLVLGLLLGMAATLAAFILMNRAAARAASEVAALLGADALSTLPAGAARRDILPLVRRRRA